MGVLERLKTGKTTLVGAVVGALVGALVGPLVGPLVVPLVDPLVCNYYENRSPQTVFA